MKSEELADVAELPHSSFLIPHSSLSAASYPFTEAIMAAG